MGVGNIDMLLVATCDLVSVVFLPFYNRNFFE